MRKFLLIIIPLLFIVCITNAQFNADENAALQLVSVNRSVIGLTADDLKNLKVSGSYLDKTIAVRYVYLQQTFKEIPVYNQIQVLAFKNNILMSNAGGRITDMDKKINVLSGIPAVSAESAVMTALSDKKITTGERAVAINIKEKGHKIEFGKMGVSRENITAQLMWVPSDDGNTIHLAWQIYFIPTINSDYWLVKIDAKNNYVLGSDNLTVYCNWSDPNHSFVFGKNHNHSTDIPKSAFGGNNLFDFKTVTKRSNELITGPAFADNGIYRVIPLPYEAPSFMPGAPSSAIVNNPWSAASANASTLKWHSTNATGTDYNYSRGNNVWAYQDRTAPANTATEAKSVTSTTALPNLTFDFMPDYNLEPIVTTPPNQQFNITNLFYYNNILHDVLYAYGFDEVGGNFQNNNLARGGVGNDHVLGEAQDGGGSNNANFSTPADGGSGRMQMYLWTAPVPDRDGDVDNGIIAHEFGHGVSNRIVGGPANVSCMNNGESSGEGISDYLGLMFTHRWDTATLNGGLTGRGIGTYALNQPPTGLGIRTQRYSTDFAINNKVYQTVLPGTVHPRGEHWCAAAWEMTWAVIQQSGTISPTIYYDGSSTAGNVVALRLITQGMKLVPCGPGFIDLRNGILNADTLLYGGAYSCSIWEAFRKRGMGAFASQGSAASASDQTPDFTAKSQVVLTASNPTIPEGQNLTYTNSVSTCSRIAISNLLLTDTLPANVTFVSATNGGTYNAGNRVVSWPVNQAPNSTVIYQFTVTVNAGSFPGNVVMRSSLFDVPAGTRRFNVSQVITPITTATIGCPAITAQPTNTTVCNNTTATFSVTASATITITYQWQVSTDGGINYTNLLNAGVYSGVNLTTLTITGVTAVMNNYLYRCIPSTACGSITSNAGILNVNVSPVITTQPATSNTGCVAGNVSYTFAANGTALTYQWQLSTTGAGGPWNNISNGGVYSGVTTATLSVTGLTAIMNGYLYRAVISGTCLPAVTTNNGALIVNTPVSITSQPANKNICATGTTSFSIAVAGSLPTYQWQVSNDGGIVWTNVSNGGIYSGVTTTTLTLTGVTTGMNGYLYRAVVAGNAPCGAVNTASAALTVSPQPTVILTAFPYTKLLPGRTTTITATVNPPTGFTTAWTRNGTAISVSSNSTIVSVNGLGTYTVVATIGSCISLPASIIIADSASSKLFVYPSPNDGRFTVSYHSPGASITNSTKQSITIYASDGRRVLNKEYAVTQPYQLHQIDMRRNGTGVYYIILREANGNKIKTGEVVVR